MVFVFPACDSHHDDVAHVYQRDHSRLATDRWATDTSGQYVDRRIRGISNFPRGTIVAGQGSQDQ